MGKRTASSTSWMVPSVPWPVSWLTGYQRPAGSLRPNLPRQTCPVALSLDGKNAPITVARAASASHRLPEHHGRWDLTVVTSPPASLHGQPGQRITPRQSSSEPGRYDDGAR